MAVSATRLELSQIADADAREKAIDRIIVITAMEAAIAKAARSRYGAETDVHAEINPKTGELRLARHLLVVDAVENPANQIILEGARRHNPAAQVGDCRAVLLCHRKGRHHGGGPLGEEGHRLVLLERLRRGRRPVGVGHGQRRDLHDVLSADAERLPAGREDA